MIGSGTTIPEMLIRIEGEYLEMPGLQLTLEQAQRLWGLDGTECAALVEALVSSGFLVRTRAGKYAMSGGAHHRFRSTDIPRLVGT